MRLGFAVKVLGQEGLKSNDSRRWQNNPHLRVSIEYAHHIFDYLEKTGINMYRISSDFAPYLTHPDLPQFHQQLKEAKRELRDLGRRALRLDLRLSFHPSQYIVLNTPREEQAALAAQDLNSQALMLDIMEQGPEAVVVTHVGGVYGEPEAALQRFARRYLKLPEPARRRLVVENDDVSWRVEDILRLHEMTGIRGIFDHQHYACLGGTEPVAACRRVLATWPDGVRPKIHFSSPRRELRTITRRQNGVRTAMEAAPLATQHADYIESAVFSEFVRGLAGNRRSRKLAVPCDVMCEAKAKDLAVLRLRQELQALGLRFTS